MMICCFAQHDYEKSRARHDQEEKLIITAWYNMVSLPNPLKHEKELKAFHGFFSLCGFSCNGKQLYKLLV